jgi:hypothetical protein
MCAKENTLFFARLHPLDFARWWCTCVVFLGQWQIRARHRHKIGEARDCSKSLMRIFAGRRTQKRTANTKKCNSNIDRLSLQFHSSRHHRISSDMVQKCKKMDARIKLDAEWKRKIKIFTTFEKKFSQNFARRVVPYMGGFKKF